MSVFFGPYIKVLKSKRVDKLVSNNGCTNEKCERFFVHTKSKYCRECGNQVTNFETTIPEEMQAYELLYEKFHEDERLTRLDYRIDMLVSNIPSPFDIVVGDEVVDISNYNMVDAMEWFVVEFRKEIDYLRSELGDENVLILFGVQEIY